MSADYMRGCVALAFFVIGFVASSAVLAGGPVLARLALVAAGVVAAPLLGLESSQRIRKEMR